MFWVGGLNGILGRLTGFWVVWLVFGWIRILELTLKTLESSRTESTGVTGFKILNAQILNLTPTKHPSTGFHVQLTPDNVQLTPNKKPACRRKCRYLNIELTQLTPKVA